MKAHTIPAAAIEAMDQAAKAFWAYPNAAWQDAFLANWMQTHGTLADLEAASSEGFKNPDRTPLSTEGAKTLAELEAESPEGFRNPGWKSVKA
jgi:hypothetical protein